MNKTVSSNRCRCCFITLLYFGESEGGRLRVEGLVLRVYGLGFRLSSGIYQSLIPVTRGVWTLNPKPSIRVWFRWHGELKSRVEKHASEKKIKTCFITVTWGIMRGIEVESREASQWKNESNMCFIGIAVESRAEGQWKNHVITSGLGWVRKKINKTCAIIGI